MGISLVFLIQHVLNQTYCVPRKSFLPLDLLMEPLFSQVIQEGNLSLVLVYHNTFFSKGFYIISCFLTGILFKVLILSWPDLH